MENSCSVTNDRIREWWTGTRGNINIGNMQTLEASLGNNFTDSKRFQRLQKFG